MNDFPEKIVFLSDDNEAELLGVGKTKSGITIGWYKYTKSVTKLDKEYPFELDYLQRLHRDGVIKVFEKDA